MSSTDVTSMITPIDEFITDTYDRIEAWENGGARRANFQAQHGEQVTVAYEVFFDDMRTHMAALEDPAGLTGRGDYGPAELLVDLRHLRDLNKNLVRAGKAALVRRTPVGAAYLGHWGTVVLDDAHDDRLIDTEAAATYVERIDAAAYRLARAIKDTAKLERQRPAQRAQAPAQQTQTRGDAPQQLELQYAVMPA